jgi:hypothetical protein
VLRIDLVVELHTDPAAVAHRTALVEVVHRTVLGEVVHRTALGEEEHHIDLEEARHIDPGVVGRTVRVEELHIDLVVGVHRVDPEVVVLHTVLGVEARRNVLEVEARRTDLVVVRHTDPEAAGRSLAVVDSLGSALEVAGYSLAVEVVRILAVGEL